MFHSLRDKLLEVFLVWHTLQFFVYVTVVTFPVAMVSFAEAALVVVFAFLLPPVPFVSSAVFNLDEMFVWFFLAIGNRNGFIL